jgi:DNA-binding beta-propeller fold protein YncE
VIDTINFTVLTSIDIPGYALDVAVSPDGRWVFAGDQYGAGLAVIDASTNTVHTVLTGLGQLIEH